MLLGHAICSGHTTDVCLRHSYFLSQAWATPREAWASPRRCPCPLRAFREHPWPQLPRQGHPTKIPWALQPLQVSLQPQARAADVQAGSLACCEAITFRLVPWHGEELQVWEASGSSRLLLSEWWQPVPVGSLGEARASSWQLLSARANE